MRWSDRHLGWIVGLGGMGAFLCSCIYDLWETSLRSGSVQPWLWVFKLVSFPVLQVMEPVSHGHYLWGDTTHLWSLAVTWAIPVVACGWVLYRKSQSPLWLLLCWIPYVGWAVPIALENRRGAVVPSSSDDVACRQSSSNAGAGTRRRAWAQALGGMAVGCAAWGAAASLFFDTVILVVAPCSEIVRHEMGLLWFIGVCASMLVLLIGFLLGGLSVVLFGSHRVPASHCRAWSKAAAGTCAVVMTVNVVALGAGG